MNIPFILFVVGFPLLMLIILLYILRDEWYWG